MWHDTKLFVVICDHRKKQKPNCILKFYMKHNLRITLNFICFNDNILNIKLKKNNIVSNYKVIHVIQAMLHYNK